jgi:hypothetical protein
VQSKKSWQVRDIRFRCGRKICVACINGTHQQEADDFDDRTTNPGVSGGFVGVT